MKLSKRAYLNLVIALPVIATISVLSLSSLPEPIPTTSKVPVCPSSAFCGHAPTENTVVLGPTMPATPPPTPQPPVATPKPKKALALSPGVEQWRSIVAEYDWPVDQALAIMKCESGGNPNSVSRTNDHGLMQINKGLALYGEQIYDPAFNIAIAYKFYYSQRGWQPWSCARKLGIS